MSPWPERTNLRLKNAASKRLPSGHIASILEHFTTRPLLTFFTSSTFMQLDEPAEVRDADTYVLIRYLAQTLAIRAQRRHGKCYPSELNPPLALSIAWAHAKGARIL